MFILVVSLGSIYFGLIIYLWNQSFWSVSFQSLHEDKKLHSHQAGLDSKVPVGCQNDLANLEKEKSKSVATVVAATNVTAGQLSHMTLVLIAHMTKCTIYRFLLPLCLDIYGSDRVAAWTADLTDM